MATRNYLDIKIHGPGTVPQLDSALRATGITLDREALDRLDAIFPGHDPAPEEYAW